MNVRRGRRAEKGLLMIRPSLVLATVLVVLVAGANLATADEWLSPVLAQSPGVTRGPGFYLNLYKLVPVLLVYLLWIWTTDWVDNDTKELSNVKFALWNNVIFFSGVLGLIMVFAIPFYALGTDALDLGLLGPHFHVCVCSKSDSAR